jgi:TonB family protein
MSQSFLALLLVFHLSLCTIKASASDNNPTFDSLLRKLNKIPTNNFDENRKDGLPSIPVPKEKIPKSGEPFDDLYREFNKKKEQRRNLVVSKYNSVLENAKKRAKDARLQLESAKNEKESIQADLKKFEEMSNSPFANEFKAKAWDQLFQKYPTFFTEFNIREVQVVKDNVKMWVESKRKELESQKKFIEFLESNTGEILKYLYEDKKNSNNQNLEESLRLFIEKKKSSADIQLLYVGMVQKKIYKNWREPLAEEHNQKTIVSFFIFPHGNIDKPRIKKSSGVEALDTLAVRAVLDSAPFPDFPKELKVSKLHISINFKYVPKDNSDKAKTKNE